MSSDIHGFNVNLEDAIISFGTLDFFDVSASASSTINYPAGIAANDIGVIFYGGYDDVGGKPASYFDPPAGYTLISRAYFNSGSGSIAAYIAVKDLTGSETSETFPTVTVSTESALKIFRPSAAGTTIFGDAENSSGFPPAALTINAPAGTAPALFLGIGLTLSGAPVTDISMTGTPVVSAGALVWGGHESVASASSGSRVLTHSYGALPGLLASGYISRS